MKVYFMGIGGTLMGHAAILGRELGDEVCGSDGPIYPPMSEMLKGMEVYVGYDAKRLQTLLPDEVVIGNNIARGNPELEAFWETKKCKFSSCPEWLRERVLGNRKTVAICGTHGKTTTTTLAALLMEKNGMKPGWLIGGVPRDLPCGARLGDPKAPFVIEGDEYDSAFFDKRAKFISYRPAAAVLNNLELDHMDIYRDIDDLKRSFNHLLRTIPSNGVVIANYDDPNLNAILPVNWVNTLWVSAKGAQKADLQIQNFLETPEGSSFDLIYKGKKWSHVSWQIWGLFNARNAAMGALAAGWALNAEDPTVLDLSSLAHFLGTKRRQEIRYQSDSLVAIEDFAHHPTAVELTLKSLKSRFPGRRWIVCLEPRSNTSRSNIHQEDYARALCHCDIAIIAPIHKADRIPPEKRLDLGKIASDLARAGKQAHLPASCSEIPSLLTKITADSSPQGVIFFSNGSFEGAMDQFIGDLKGRKPLAV